MEDGVVGIKVDDIASPGFVLQMDCLVNMTGIDMIDAHFCADHIFSAHIDDRTVVGPLSLGANHQFHIVVFTSCRHHIGISRSGIGCSEISFSAIEIDSINLVVQSRHADRTFGTCCILNDSRSFESESWHSDIMRSTLEINERTVFVHIESGILLLPIFQSCNVEHESIEEMHILTIGSHILEPSLT